MTAFLAAAFLKERSLGWRKLFAYTLGVAGLLVMFMSAMDLNQQALFGVAGILVSTFFQPSARSGLSVSTPVCRRLHSKSPAACYSRCRFIICRGIVDQCRQLPAEIPDKTLYAIIYLGVIATTLGLAFYYYVLNNLPATNVAMINLMTPVLSLLLGYSINHETISLKSPSSAQA